MKKRIAFLIFFIAFFINLHPVTANADDTYRILYLSSYAYSWESVPNQISGIKEVIADSGTIDYEFMDTKNTSYDEQYTQYYDYLKFKLESRAQYQAVIVADDAALDFAMMYQEDLFKNIPIVFMGIDDFERAQEAQSNEYMTGIAERADYEKNFELAKDMCKDSDTFVFVVDDSLNGIGIQKQIEQYKDLLSDYNIEYINSSKYTTDELCDKLSKISENDIVFFMCMGQGKNGEIYTTDFRYKIFNQYVNRPAFRVSSSGIGNGMLGGYIVDHHECGIMAAQMVLDILGGKEISSMELVTDTPSEYCFDQQIIDKYDLKIPSYAKDASIINPDESFIQIHFRQIIFGLIVIIAFLLAIFLFVQTKSKGKLIRANNAKTDFLSRMSHDMRTPMNAIIGMTTIANDIKGNPKQTKECLQKIDTSGKFLLNLINDILDMSKIEKKMMTLTMEPYEWKDFELQMNTLIEPLCAQKNITYTFLMDNKGVDCVMADSVRIEQIIFNLVSNAIKYSNEGGHVSLSLCNKVQEDNYVNEEFIISDDGIGMTQEFQKHMFEAFTQENKKHIDAKTGSGLGLAIVKNLVSLYKGDISVTSESGEGTTFTINIRFEICNEKKEEKNNSQDYSKFEGIRVLLCEDNEINMEIEEMFLKQKDMIITKAVNGKQAVDIFDSSELGSFDVILMDIRMPVMDGLEATRAIRSLDRDDSDTIPIIAMTANAFEEDLEQSREAGMDAHLCKPINTGLMFKTIASLLNLD